MPQIATTALAVLCVLGMALQFYDPFVGGVATFAPALVTEGEWHEVFSGEDD